MDAQLIADCRLLGILAHFISRYSRVLPMYLKPAMDSKDSDLNSSSTPSEGTEDEMKVAAQDIACYQVVLSREGKIVEFQPTSLVAEYQWAANPLVKELYEKKKFCLIERGLKMITRPNDDVVLELLLSSNPQSSFAFVRLVTENSRTFLDRDIQYLYNSYSAG
ncbi:hypothetical protein P3S67_013590 [Capsicum chacoense]